MSDEEYEGFDRVTKILDFYQAPELIDWKIRVGKKEARRISTVATKIGTNVDEAVRAEIAGKKAPKLNSEEAKNCWVAWKKWCGDYGILPSDLVAGTRLFNQDSKVCGEPDVLIRGVEVLDVKCSGEIRQAYWIQNNWYAKELGYSWRSVLRLDKNLAIYQYERREVSEEDSKVFEALTTAYRYFRKGREEDEELS